MALALRPGASKRSEAQDSAFESGCSLCLNPSARCRDPHWVAWTPPVLLGPAVGEKLEQGGRCRPV
ncbi:MAG: hypothetical protein DWI28_07175 [Planctomycetota bacterium]|nr:MAG: hypothetical protein DWI28_07175 [Planctomycetota bacterium]